MSALDLLDNPEYAYLDLDGKKYGAELELVDRYRSFVSEMLRLSVLGIAVFGFLYKYLFKDSNTAPEVLILAAIGIIAFALSAIFALIFLYFANEGFRWYIVGLRYNKKARMRGDTDKESAQCSNEIICANTMAQKAARIRQGPCTFSKKFAAFFLAAGAIFVALAMIWHFFQQILHTAL